MENKTEQPKKKFNSKTYINSMRRVLARNKGVSFFLIFSMIALGIVGGLEVLVIAEVFQAAYLLYEGVRPFSVLVTALLWFITLKVAERLLECFSDIVMDAYVKIRTEKTIEDVYFNKLNRIPFLEFIKTGSRKNFDLARNGVFWYSHTYATSLYTIYRIAVLGSVAISLLSFHWSLAVVLFASIVPVFISAYKMTKQRYEQFNRLEDDRRALWVYQNAVMDRYQTRELRSFNSIEYLVQKFKAKNEYINEDQLALRKRHARNYLMIDILRGLFIMATFSLAVFLVIKGNIAIGSFVACFSAVLVFSDSLYKMAWDVANIAEGCFRMDNTEKFLTLPEEEVGSQKIESFHDRIQIQNGCFAYPLRDGETEQKNILNNLNLTLKKGEKVAIVGLNGSGKTTLIAVLLGLLQLNSGTLLVDGQNINDLNIASYRSLITLVLQDFAQYHLTLRQNIAVSNLNEKDDTDRIELALKQAVANDAVTQAQGLDTQMGREFNGAELSHGQWQKVAIGRGMFRQNADIFLFDEPTSALDAIVEDEIFTNFLKEVQNKTAVVISHRLSLCSQVDRVIYFENGQVLEEGTHKELLKKKGKYYDMYSSQQKWY